MRTSVHQTRAPTAPLTALLNQIPELVPGLHDGGVLVDAMLTSVVASYAFYLLVVHLKAEDDRATVWPYVRKHARAIVAECRRAVDAVARTAGVDLDLDTLTDQQIAAALAGLPIRPAPLLIGPNLKQADWLEYFSHVRTETRERAERASTQTIYLDARLVHLLVSVDDCALFSWTVDMISFRGLPGHTLNLSRAPEPFYAYCELCRELDAYLNKYDPPTAGASVP